jgi:hypothetical protein
MVVRNLVLDMNSRYKQAKVSNVMQVKKKCEYQLVVKAISPAAYSSLYLYLNFTI